MQVGEGAGEDEGDTAELTASSIRAKEVRRKWIDGGQSSGLSFHGDRPERGIFRPGSGWNRSGERRRRCGMGLGRPSREESEEDAAGMAGAAPALLGSGLREKEEERADRER